MSKTKEKLDTLRKKILLTGAFVVAGASFSGASAQESTVQNNQPNKQENTIPHEQNKTSYCNLANKVWNMYRLAYTDGNFLNTIDVEETEKCKAFFERHPVIKQFCQDADKAIGGTIRGPRTMNAAERKNPDFRDQLNKTFSQDVIQEIDGIGSIKIACDEEYVADKIWHMYTYVATHGGTDKQNQCANFFKKYPEIYGICKDFGIAMNNTVLPLERSTYEDVMYYNMRMRKETGRERRDWTGKERKDWRYKDLDEVIELTMYEIAENRKITEKQIQHDIEKTNVPNNSQQGNDSKIKYNAFSLEY